MDGPFIATVIFKSNTKNCFVSVPSKWIQNCRHETVVVFEIQRQDGTSLYFSWSGDVSPTDNTIIIAGFYALKLGLNEGEEVTVTTKRNLNSIESLTVEPISIDDWEILELHTDFIQNNILNQIRVVWNCQLLPVWVNQSVCIFVKLSNISPANCEIGLLVNSTELHITPKERKSKAALSNGNISNARLEPIKSQTIDTNHEKQPEPKWDFTNKLKNALNSWSSIKSNDTHNEQVLEQEEKRDKIIENEKSASSVCVRVHPLDNATILEYLSSVKDNDIKTLLLQPTSVLITSTNCGIDHTKHGDPILFGQLCNMVTLNDNTKNKNKQTSIKVKKTCYVKVILIDRLLDKVGKGSDYWRLLTKLIKEQSDNAILIPETVRRFINCQVTSRVQLTIVAKPKTLKPTKIQLFPMNDITINIEDVKKTKMQEMNNQIDKWRNDICSLSCPLALSNKFIMKIAINGIENEFILQTTDATERDDVLLLITQATVLQAKWDVVVKDDNLKASQEVCEWNVEWLGLPSMALGGVDQLITECKHFLNMGLRVGELAKHLRTDKTKFPAGGLLICGCSGAGKTWLVRALARDYAHAPNYVYIDYISCKAMKGKRVEWVTKKWDECFALAAARQPAIIILDDLDQLVGTSSGPENELGSNYRAKLADKLKDVLRSCVGERASVVIVATAKSISSLHPTLVSAQGLHLFQKVIKINPPNFDQRVEMLKRLVVSKPLIASQVVDSVDWAVFSRQTEGYLARDLNAILDRALHKALTNINLCGQPEVLLQQQHLQDALKDYVPISLRSLDVHSATDKSWSDVGGLADVKRALIETLEWPAKYPKLFANCPLPVRSGILIYGPPGSGKTLLAAAVAKECNMNFISIKGPELLSKYIGASEQAVRDLFERAAMAKPCVIFFDEFDSLAPRRGHDSTGVTDRVVNQLLTQLDGVEGRKGVYVLAATSRPDLIDPALLRPGRLDKCLHCSLPSKEERLQILRALSRRMTLSDAVDLSQLAERCLHFSGADLQGVVQQAHIHAAQRHLAILPLNTPPHPPPDTTHFRQLQNGPELPDLPYLQSQIQKINNVMSNVRKIMGDEGNEEDEQPSRSGSVVVVEAEDFERALVNTRPSVTAEERRRYQKIYESFSGGRSSHFEEQTTTVVLPSVAGNRATLA